MMPRASVRVMHSSLITSVSGEIMKKTTASVFAATAAFGIIAASAGIAFAAESPIGDGAKGNPSIGDGAKGNPSIGQPTPEPSAPSVGPENPMPTPEPSNPTPEGPSEEPTPEPMTPGTRVPGGETPAPNEEPSAPEPAAPGTGTSVTTRGEVTKGNSPAPVSARTGIRNTNAPADTSAPMLANTGSSATIAAGAGVIALAGGVTLVIARKRH